MLSFLTDPLGQLRKSALFERYRVAVVLEPSVSRPLYAWEHWSGVMPLLSPVIGSLTSSASIRSDQLDGLSNKGLTFGPMKWSDASNRKWTTKYLADPALFGRVLFLRTEIWAPSRSKSFETGRGPEFFCLVDRNEPAGTQGFVLALRKDLLPGAAAAADAVVARVHAFYTDPKLAVFDRTWGEHGRFGSIVVDNGLDWTSSDAVMLWAERHPRTHVRRFAGR
jgi:hypothetical protein